MSNRESDGEEHTARVKRVGLYKPGIGGCPACGAHSDKVRRSKFGHHCKVCGVKLL